jgi:hypothetical protein
MGSYVALRNNGAHGRSHKNPRARSACGDVHVHDFFHFGDDLFRCGVFLFLCVCVSYVWLCVCESCMVQHGRKIHYVCVCVCVLREYARVSTCYRAEQNGWGHYLFNLSLCVVVICKMGESSCAKANVFCKDCTVDQCRSVCVCDDATPFHVVY